LITVGLPALDATLVLNLRDNYHMSLSKVVFARKKRSSLRGLLVRSGSEVMFKTFLLHCMTLIVIAGALA